MSSGKRTLLGKLKLILARVHPDFLALIDVEELKDVLSALDKTGDEIEPPAELIFEWLRYTSLDRVLGMLCMQDPYPNDAIGLCCAKLRSCGLPQSFRPVVACLQRAGLMRARAGRHADLRPWAVQGLLMPNMALTTRRGESKAHFQIWKMFVTRLLTRIFAALQERRRGAGAVFLLAWGGDAKGLTKIAEAHGAVVFSWSHPSPMSDNKQPEPKKFVNCDGFERANALMEEAWLAADDRRVAPRRFVWDNMAPVVAFADGACRANGKKGARAGFGVAIVGGQFRRTELWGAVEASEFALTLGARGVSWPSPDLENHEMVSEKGYRVAVKVPPFAPTGAEARPSNNRGELLAFCWAAAALLAGWALGPVVIVSDSQISVRTFDEWLPARRKRGTERELKNYDLIEVADKLLSTLRQRAVKVTLLHVNASHDGKLAEDAPARARLLWQGNDRADELAKAAVDCGVPIAVSSPLQAVEAFC